MAENMMTPADVAAVTRNDDNDFFGGNGVWAIIIFVIAAMFLNGGGFFGNNANNTTTDSLLLSALSNNRPAPADYGNTNTLINEFIQRDIAGVGDNVYNSAMQLAMGNCQTQRDVLENRYATQLAFTQSQAQAQNCCCEVKGTVADAKYALAQEVQQNRYDAAIQAQVAAAQLAECCCDIKTAVHAEGEQTRALITSNTIQELRDNLQAAQLQLGNLSQTNTLISTLRPTPTPAYVTCSPYQSYGFGLTATNGCGCGL
jgi:hypothetical protein